MIKNNFKDKYGKWALITGASSGIGKGFAHKLAASGINLCLVARRKNLLEELKTKLLNYKIDIVIINSDLATQEGIQKVIDDTSEIDISILVNNAGYGWTGNYEKMEANEISQMIDVNIKNYQLLTKHFSSLMIAKKRGAIFIISSVVANIPVPFMSLYSVTKAANLAFGETLWYELKKHNIEVCTICPGSTKTEFNGLRSKGKSTNVRSVEDVVETAFKSIGKKVVVTDGFINKLNSFVTKYLSRKLRINIVGKIASKVLNQ
jgi:short-subunit dehydrogenase